MGQPTNRVALFLFLALIAGTALVIGTHHTTDADSAPEIAPAAGPADRCDGIDPVGSFICRNTWMVFQRYGTR